MIEPGTFIKRRGTLRLPTGECAPKSWLYYMEKGGVEEVFYRSAEAGELNPFPDGAVFDVESPQSA